jgi:glycosyltransferase involved in cell wall biosynthesis
VKKAERLHRPWLLCPHSIDTSVYVPPAHPRPERPEVVLIAVGNLIPRKGYDLLFEALAAMKLPEESRWTLKCFGSGSTSELSALAESLGISDRIGLFSFAGLDQLIQAYQDADIFVHPCRADTYGIVVHEAAACGLPLVVSKFAGASETLIKEGENGYSVDPEDASIFGKRLAHLISRRDLRQTFGQVSRQLAEQWDVKSNGRRAFSWLTQGKQRK